MLMRMRVFVLFCFVCIILLKIMLNLFAHHTLVEGDYNLDEIAVHEEIERGNSHVYKIMIKNNYLALKQIEVKTDYEYQSFLKEISYMKQLSEVSQYMIKYVGYFVTLQEINQYSKRKYAHIVMECAEMNLQNLIAYRVSQGNLFTKRDLLIIIDFLLEAFMDLERNKIAHCDIKPQNILVLNSETLRMKLCDVGSCKFISSEEIEEATIFGTVPFLAPELLKMKSKKIISSNAFKSDVFSLGLVFLYLIINKKFSSKQRIEIPDRAYYQVIVEWQKEAREITNYDSRISQILKHCLQFQQFKRPLFSGVKAIYEGEKKKKKINLENKLKKLQLEESEKKTKIIEQNFQSVQNNEISLFKSRNLNTKISNRTTRIGFPKISQKYSSRGPSPSPISPTSPLSKRQSSQFSSSPERGVGMNSTVLDFKKIIYVTEEEKDFIPYNYFNQDEKNFVLFTSYVGFRKADCVSIFPSCSLQAIYELKQVEGNKLYIQYEGVEGIGVAEDVPILSFRKIYANLSKTSLIGGYKYIFRSFCGDELESLELKLTGSDACFDDIIELLDILVTISLKSFTLIWQSFILTPEEHFQFTEKVAKLSVKKLVIVMNENFVKYDKETRWLLPKACEVLYIEYGSNFLGKILSNLAISISKCPIKELYLNFSNNNITKSEANFIFKTVTSIELLQKLVLNLSWNTIDDTSYMLTEFQKLKNITSLELRLDHCSISEQKVIEAISELKYLFDCKLKILKIGYDRTMRKDELQDLIEKNLQPLKNLKIDVLGRDNKYFYIFIKKKDKGSKNKSNAATNRVKGEKVSLGTKSIAINQKIPEVNKNGFCQAFICNHENFETYLCLACSNLRELSKNQYFCKHCIENCGHKGHNFVKIYERNRCKCAYSGNCSTDMSKQLCAEELNIKSKKQYECLKCQKLLCQGCSTYCMQYHKNWVEESKQVLFFQCQNVKK